MVSPDSCNCRFLFWLQAKVDSIPYPPIRRKRQRLPPSLIENGSDRDLNSAPTPCPRFRRYSGRCPSNFWTHMLAAGVDLMQGVCGGRLSRVAPLADLSSSSTRTHIEWSQSSQSARDRVMGF